MKILVPKTSYEVMWERLVDHLGPGGAAEAVFDYVIATADERLKRILVKASGRKSVRLLQNEQAVVHVIFWENGSLRRIGQHLVGYLWQSGKLSEPTGRKVVMGADAPSAQLEYVLQPTPPVRQFPYDVALSSASEQRRYVRRVYKKLLQLGVQTFYDEGEEVNLWGKNLEPHLQKVFYKMARACVVFVSKHYVGKPWPMFEAESALVRAVQERGEYVLPVRFDNSELPGLLPTIKYVWAKDYTPERLAENLADQTEGPRVVVQLDERPGERITEFPRPRDPAELRSVPQEAGTSPRLMIRGRPSSHLVGLASDPIAVPIEVSGSGGRTMKSVYRMSSQCS